ncbi:hypothetical protein BDBG_02984 [Blastomyces gilchristii SLH14081]|uniref:Uncharacterized protein n=1 Tax=Blastomyces gilchristii (strain SLH14081) TaxID=559298 RepID=A0A179UGG4_BLAGS|nr:uncharacterized protein BDBG_02984 [Blastomyces gilchristii SLH14081]OAT06843.1 hypothetical protein BDBG_02984 [Blastomyces gilchristii SLH14081]
MSLTTSPGRRTVSVENIEPQAFLAVRDMSRIISMCNTNLKTIHGYERLVYVAQCCAEHAHPAGHKLTVVANDGTSAYWISITDPRSQICRRSDRRIVTPNRIQLPEPQLQGTR